MSSPTALESVPGVVLRFTASSIMEIVYSLRFVKGAALNFAKEIMKSFDACGRIGDS